MTYPSDAGSLITNIVPSGNVNSDACNEADLNTMLNKYNFAP